jgi:hypothetical protein
MSENTDDLKDAKKVMQKLNDLLSPLHEAVMGPEEANEYQLELINRFAADDPQLKNQYVEAAPKVAALFDSWFGTGK